MTEFSFVLRYRLSPDDCVADEIVERLGEAGCTDAFVGIGVAGRLALDFTREADSAHAAVTSALADVRRAVPMATLVEASPDLVGLTDVAATMGVARQSIRKLMLASPDFPSPVYEGSVSLWHLADILAWMQGRKGYEPEPLLLETARATLAVNVAKEAKRYDSIRQQSFEGLVA